MELNYFNFRIMYLKFESFSPIKIPYIKPLFPLKIYFINV